MQNGYESAEAAAARLGVTVRAVQKWASEGKLDGAYRMGRMWLIPVNAQKTDNSKHAERASKQTVYPVLPMMHSVFDADHFFDSANSLSDQAVRDMALAEYYYYTGEPERASDICELYINDSNLSIALSASLSYLFANFSTGKFHLVELGLDLVKYYTKSALEQTYSEELRAVAVYIVHLINALLHISILDVPPIQSVMAALPEGYKYSSCYIIAYNAYRSGDITRAIGIADTTLALGCRKFPIIATYIYLILAVSLLGLKQIDNAKACFNKAWALSSSGGSLLVVTEHYDMMQGLAELCLRKSHSAELEKIIAMSKHYGIAWRRIQKDSSTSQSAEHFSPDEIAIAGLYRRSWSVKEISDYLGFSQRTVKHHISVIYEKLDISSRSELIQYFIR